MTHDDMYKHTTPVHYQFKDESVDSEWRRQIIDKPDKHLRGSLVPMLRKHPESIIYHSMVADFWIWKGDKHGTGLQAALHNVLLPNITTPYMEQLVNENILVPVCKTLEEHKMQAILGLSYSVLRAYILNPNKRK